MKTLANLTYVAIVLAFVRKIIDKCTYEARAGLPVYHHDDEGCYCLCYGEDFCLEYSHDKFGLTRMGNELMREIPKLAGKLRLIEDDNMCTRSACQIPTLSQEEAARADSIIVAYDL